MKTKKAENGNAEKLKRDVAKLGNRIVEVVRDFESKHGVICERCEFIRDLHFDNFKGERQLVSVSAPRFNINTHDRSSHVLENQESRK